jgi:hypothetical protein
MTAKQYLRQLASPLLQQLFRRSWFDRFFDGLVYEQKRVRRRRIEARLQAEGRYPDVVLRGPLAGTRFPPGYASCRFEKIIGAYEAETQAWIEELMARGGFTALVNIGAAEGSYAAGLARRIPDIPVHAFEANLDLHSRIRELAELNGVADRLHLHGRCELAALQQLDVGTHPLVICDVEGYELELLRPEVLPWLRGATLFVELHDCLVAGSGAEIRRRFEGTHRLRFEHSRGLDYAAYPELAGLSFAEIYAMVLEDRPAPQDWLLAEPSA